MFLQKSAPIFTGAFRKALQSLVVSRDSLPHGMFRRTEYAIHRLGAQCRKVPAIHARGARRDTGAMFRMQRAAFFLFHARLRVEFVYSSIRLLYRNATGVQGRIRSTLLG